MSAMAYQITSLTIVYSAVYSGANQRKTSKLRVTGLCEGNSPATGEFSAQRASNAENGSIWMTSSCPFIAERTVRILWHNDVYYSRLGRSYYTTMSVVTHLVCNLQIHIEQNFFHQPSRQLNLRPVRVKGWLNGPVSQMRAPLGGLSRTSRKLWQDYLSCCMFLNIKRNIF